jgi:hypothetical protein
VIGNTYAQQSVITSNRAGMRRICSKRNFNLLGGSLFKVSKIPLTFPKTFKESEQLVC